MSGGTANGELLVVRWTIGAVRERGYEMLALSLVGAWRLFGPAARYIVCVNTVGAAAAEQRAWDALGEARWAVPEELRKAVRWQEVGTPELAAVLLPYVDGDCIEGMGWKLAPLRVLPERYELAIDNDVILWGLPEAVERWLAGEERLFVFAEDVDRCFGSFEGLVPREVTPSGGLNAGIRGLPPGETMEAELRWVLEEADRQTRGSQREGEGFRLQGEIEEQGLQAAAMVRAGATKGPLLLVRNEEVSLCSPFWPKRPVFGSCGAHFVGMNAAHIPWDYYDRPADVWLAEHWARSREELYRRVGLTA